MKNKLFFAIASAALAVACSKNAPVGEQTSLPVVPDDGIHRAELISFNTNVYSVATAKAALDSWDSQPIFIYGVNKTNGDLHINNDAATAPADGDNYITLSNTYYYDPNNTCYDFYGYYVDDAILGPVSVSEGNITYPVTITGSQDIMLAKADQATDIAGKVNNPAYAYSAYSARRGVVPNLEFKHQLSKFTFQIKAGSASGATVAVTNLTLTSKTTGDLTVVGAQGLVGNGDTTPLTLALPADCTPDWDVVSGTAGAPKVLGDLMVIPGEASYDLEVSLGDIVPAIPISITPGDVGATSFDAGYAYTITVIIYGIEEIKITASMAPWVDGGDMTFDPDEEWSNNDNPVIP